MAVIWNGHGGSPENAGERRVVEHLGDKLPDSYYIIPSIDIQRNDGKGSDEIDALIIAPYGLVVVEVKDYRRTVVFKEHEHLVGSEKRVNPIAKNRGKSRRLAGRIRDFGNGLERVWVTDQVVLARKPENLHVDPLIRHRVVEFERMVQRLSDPKAMLPEHVTYEPFDPQRVLAAIGVYGNRRKPSRRYGNYRTKNLIEEELSRRLYHAEHQVTGRMVALQVNAIDPYLSETEKERVRSKSMRSFKALDRLKETGSQNVIGPTEVFETDNGDVVTVSSLDTGVSLMDFVESGASMTGEFAEAVIRDVGMAIKTAHEIDIFHRRLEPSVVYLDVGQKDPEGIVAKVSGWDRADLGTSDGATTMTLTVMDKEFVAPEVLDNDVDSWKNADLYSLASLIKWMIANLEIGSDKTRVAFQLENLIEDILEEPEVREILTVADILDAIEFAADIEGDGFEITSPEEFVEGKKLGQQFMIERKLGQGGQAKVFQVRDLLNDETRALKIFPQSAAIQNIRDERAAIHSSGVGNRNIVKVFDITPTEVGLALPMEFLEGETLTDRLRRTPPDSTETIRWFRELFEALVSMHGETHGRPVVHRDIKPSNIMVCDAEDGSDYLVLIDFGIGFIEGNTPIPAGSVRYRPYSAPADANEPSLDLFALTVTFHETLTGSHPWDDLEVCKGPPSLSEELDDEMRELFQRALSPEREEQRLETAAEILEALDKATGAPPQRDSEVLKRDSEVVNVGGKLILEVFSQEGRMLAVPPSGRTAKEARCVTARVSANPDVTFDVCWYQVIDDGATWVEVAEAHTLSAAEMDLVGRLRAGIYPTVDDSDLAYMELNQVSVSDGSSRPQQLKATLEELNSGASVDIEELLTDLGAVSVSDRKHAMGDRGRRRLRQCVVFEPENQLIPLVGYVLSHIAPLVDGKISEPNKLPDDELGGFPPSAPLTMEAPPYPYDEVGREERELEESLASLDDQLEEEDKHLPRLNTSLSEPSKGKGKGRVWREGCEYNVVHDRNPWRVVRSPFATLETALFGDNGAQAIITNRKKFEERIKKNGVPLLVIIKIGEDALLVGGGEDDVMIAHVDWEKVQPLKTAANMELYYGSMRRKLDRSLWSDGEGV